MNKIFESLFKFKSDGKSDENRGEYKIFTNSKKKMLSF